MDHDSGESSPHAGARLVERREKCTKMTCEHLQMFSDLQVAKSYSSMN